MPCPGLSLHTLQSAQANKEKWRKNQIKVVSRLHREICRQSPEKVSTGWCFGGECLLQLEAFIERPIELLLMAGIGNAPCACG